MEAPIETVKRFVVEVLPPQANAQWTPTAIAPYHETLEDAQARKDLAISNYPREMRIVEETTTRKVVG
jgi:hypothetical protein